MEGEEGEEAEVEGEDGRFGIGYLQWVSQCIVPKNVGRTVPPDFGSTRKSAKAGTKLNSLIGPHPTSPKPRKSTLQTPPPRLARR